MQIAPGSRGLTLNQGVIFRIHFNVNRTEQSKDTKRTIFCNIYYENKLKITPKGKWTATVRNSIIYYLCDVLLRAQFDRKLLRPVVDFLLPMGAMGSFTSTNLRHCARYFKACLSPCMTNCIKLSHWKQCIVGRPWYLL